MRKEFIQHNAYYVLDNALDADLYEALSSATDRKAHAKVHQDVYITVDDALEHFLDIMLGSWLYQDRDSAVDSTKEIELVKSLL